MGMCSGRLNKSRSGESRLCDGQTEILRCAQNDSTPVAGE